LKLNSTIQRTEFFRRSIFVRGVSDLDGAGKSSGPLFSQKGHASLFRCMAFLELDRNAAFVST
jgi:hypothetical protein